MSRSSIWSQRPTLRFQLPSTSFLWTPHTPHPPPSTSLGTHISIYLSGGGGRERKNFEKLKKIKINTEEWMHKIGQIQIQCVEESCWWRSQAIWCPSEICDACGEVEGDEGIRSCLKKKTKIRCFLFCANGLKNNAGAARWLCPGRACVWEDCSRSEGGEKDRCIRINGTEFFGCWWGREVVWLIVLLCLLLVLHLKPCVCTCVVVNQASGKDLRWQGDNDSDS